MKQFTFLNTMITDKVFDEFKDNFIKNFYYDVDRAHGKFHIETCYKNAVFGYPKTNNIKDLDKHFVYLCVIAHDIGCSIRTAKLFNYKYKTNNDVRPIHNILGAEYFTKLYNMDSYEENKRILKVLFPIEKDFYIFKALCNNDGNVSKGSIAISEHRASVKQNTPLSEFLRSCDGLNTAEFIMMRAILYQIDNLHLTNERDIIIEAKTHLMEKYCGNNPYSKSLPNSWANQKFESERKILKSILLSIDYDKPETYLKYFNFLK